MKKRIVTLYHYEPNPGYGQASYIDGETHVLAVVPQSTEEEDRVLDADGDDFNVVYTNKGVPVGVVQFVAHFDYA